MLRIMLGDGCLVKANGAFGKRVSALLFLYFYYYATADVNPTKKNFRIKMYCCFT